MAKIIGNTTATPVAIPDWNQTDEKKADYIKNKPENRLLPEAVAADSGKYLRVNTAGEWEIQTGSTGDGSGGDGGTVSSATYVEYISDGTTDITIAAANNTIFSIQGYTSVTIVKSVDLDELSIWECYFYIHFSDSTKVSLKLPSDMRCNGDSPNYVKPGDIWEISINKQGGAVCLRT